MKDMLQYKAENYTIEYQKKKLWQRFVFAMAVVVVFCTTYALILPAITWEIEQNSTDLSLSEDGVYCCGMAAHTHSEESGCYDADGTLICNIPEHVHTEACLTESEEDNETSGALGVEADETGTGSDDETLTEEEYCCGLEAHMHSPEEGCYSPEDGSLICTIQEHIHTEACRNHPKEDDKTADVSEPEKTGTETDTADPAPAENDRSADVSEPEKTETGTDSADPPITKDDEIADALEKAFEGIGLPGIGDGDRVLDSGEVPEDTETSPEDTETSPEDTETSPEEPVLSSPVADVAKERKSFRLLTSGTRTLPEDPKYVPDDPVGVTLSKQIDWLGDNDVELGGGVGTEDLYRLYLSLETGMIEPMDLLLVIDQSGSMAESIHTRTYYYDIDLDNIENEGFEYDDDYEAWFYYDDETGYVLYYDEDDFMWIDDFDIEGDDTGWWDFDGYDEELGWYFSAGYGDTRQEALLNFLNGDEENNHSDGFINLFRNANRNNRLAVLSFSADCSMKPERYLMKWDDDEVSIDPPKPYGATNYAAAFDIANQVLAEAEDSQNRKVMIFLSDGAPTLAYADGAMHHGFDETENGTSVIGTGNNYSNRTLCDYIDIFISLHERGGSANSWYREINATLDYDDDSNPHSAVGHFIEPYSTSDMEHPAYEWPLTYDLTDMDLNIPGTAFPEWDITKQEDYEEFVSEWKNMTEEDQIDWLRLHTQPGDGYDIFYLSETAFSEFSEHNDDVPVFAMFFSDDADKQLQSGTYLNEVLKYMSGDEHTDAPVDRYYHYQSIGSAEALANAIQSIIGLSNVKITDPLSDYVDFEIDPEQLNDGLTLEKMSQLEIKLTNAAYSGEYDFAYLYKDGGFTDLGEALLDMDATKIDAESKTVNVVFRPDILFTDVFKCEASFNVRVNDYAYDTYVQSGYDAEGEPFTDYTGNTTSSEKPGFYSNVQGVYSKDDPDDNEGAIAEWTYYGNNGAEYKMPVVQLQLTEIGLHKVASDNTNHNLAGAEFDIYRELATGDGCDKVIDENEGTHYLKKVNDSAVVSGDNGTAEVENLRAGHYYLFETEAPDGYYLLDKPVSFDVVSSVVNGQVEFEINYTSDNVNAAVESTNKLSLLVKNVPGHNLPITGGTGRYILYALGVLLIAGSLLCGFILRRKRERRDE